MTDDQAGAAAQSAAVAELLGHTSDALTKRTYIARPGSVKWGVTHWPRCSKRDFSGTWSNEKTPSNRLTA